mmetsp:Transcript_28945/g.69880  ORF Transcript_28945/g.69880 Transcript_28945/m.69880 type:complete len:453 (-) Transcript_28945:852-2210(-)
MSTNPEPTAVKGANPEPASSTKPAAKSGFGIFGSLPFIGMNNKTDNSTEPMNVDKKEDKVTDKVTPPESTKPASQASVIADPKPLVQATNLDKIKPSVDSKSANEAANIAPAQPTVATKESKTNTPASTKPGIPATITEKPELPIQSATVDKVKPTAEDKVAKGAPGAKSIAAKKTNNTKPAEKPKPAEKSKATDTKKPADNGKITETKEPAERKKPAELKKPAEINKLAEKLDDKTKTSEVDDDKGKQDDQGTHSLGGESANQFTPPLPEDFLKKAQADIDASKQFNGSNIASRVNSQIPSSRPLESKTEDLLVAPIIPRPKKRPAAKSLLKQLGQSHVTRSLKKVKSVIAKTEKQSPGRAKSPGRGRRASQSKSPARRGPSATRAKLLSEGPPTEELEGGWPEGWVKRVFERASGATKGSTDKYWYSPINGVKLRSIVEGKILNALFVHA